MIYKSSNVPNWGLLLFIVGLWVLILTLASISKSNDNSKTIPEYDTDTNVVYTYVYDEEGNQYKLISVKERE